LAVGIGILGAIIGTLVGVLFTEVIFVNNQSWPDVVPFALAILGYLVASRLARYYAGRNAEAPEHPGLKQP
jgi:presenilin-like A22 family membrane protease